MVWCFNYKHKELPHAALSLTVDISAETELEASDWFSKHCSTEPHELVSVLIKPQWFSDELHKKFSALMHELDRTTQQVNQTADYYESEARELKLKLLLERFDGLSDAIEIFYNTRLHFNRTDEYIGICDNEDRYLIKATRKISK